MFHDLIICDEKAPYSESYFKRSLLLLYVWLKRHGFPFECQVSHSKMFENSFKWWRLPAEPDLNIQQKWWALSEVLNMTKITQKLPGEREFGIKKYTKKKLECDLVESWQVPSGKTPCNYTLLELTKARNNRVNVYEKLYKWRVLPSVISAEGNGNLETFLLFSRYLRFTPSGCRNLLVTPSNLLLWRWYSSTKQNIQYLCSILFNSFLVDIVGRKAKQLKLQRTPRCGWIEINKYAQTIENKVLFDFTKEKVDNEVTKKFNNSNARRFLLSNYHFLLAFEDHQKQMK